MIWLTKLEIRYIKNKTFISPRPIYDITTYKNMVSIWVGSTSRRFDCLQAFVDALKTYQTYQPGSTETASTNL